MSAPNTNVKKQEKRHKGPLWGMVWAVAVALILLVGLVLWMTGSGNEPGNDEPVDGSAVTGESAGDAAE